VVRYWEHDPCARVAAVHPVGVVLFVDDMCVSRVILCRD